VDLALPHRHLGAQLPGLELSATVPRRLRSCGVHSGSFAPPDTPVERLEIIPPAIDPESPKNIELGLGTAGRLLQWIGVDEDKPLVNQVSRFDPWKDPLGVIAAYQLVKHEVPDLQLALVGSMALDDSEGWEIYRQIQDVAKNDSHVHLFTNLTGVGNVEVNAFQRLSDVVIQKSIRAGFGLVVSETLWKGTPVVAGRAGGIPLQLQGGAGGFLIDFVEECAEKTLWLLRHPEEGEALGTTGRELVRKRFLLTRLIADEFRLYGDLLGTRQLPTPVAKVGLAGEERDPVCGMLLDPEKAPEKYEYGSDRYYFCSRSCQVQFEAAPEYFLRAIAGVLGGSS
jgi:trehalose synthase